MANTLLSLVRHEAVTSVTSPIIGQIPSQQEPKTLVHDAQPIFSTYKNNLFETERASSQTVFIHIWFQEKVLALKDTSHLKDNILIKHLFSDYSGFHLKLLILRLLTSSYKHLAILQKLPALPRNRKQITLFNTAFQFHSKLSIFTLCPMTVLYVWENTSIL